MRSQHNLPRIIPEYTYARFNPYFLWKSFWYPMKINIQYAPCMEYLPTFALKSPSFVGKYTSTMEHMGITIASTTNIPIYHKSMNPSVGMVSWAPTHPIWNLQVRPQNACCWFWTPTSSYLMVVINQQHITGLAPPCKQGVLSNKKTVCKTSCSFGGE